MLKDYLQIHDQLQRYLNDTKIQEHKYFWPQCVPSAALRTETELSSVAWST